MTDIAPPLRQVFIGDDRLSATVGKVRRELAGLKGEIGPLGRALGESLAPLAAGATLAGLTSWVRRVADGQDALNDLKDAGGGSIETLSALEDLALRNGHSYDVASDALIKLNKALFEASDDPNSDAARAFKGLGVDIKEVLALQPVERMQAVARAFASFGGENKLEYSLAVFKRSAQEVMPILNDMAEAGKLVGTVTTAEAEAAEKFNKQLAGMNKNVLDVSRSLAGPLISGFNSFAEAIRGGGFTRDLDNLLSWTNLAGNAFRGLGGFIGGTAAQAAALARGDLKGAAAIGQAMLDDARAAREDLERAAKLKDVLASVPQASYSNEGRNYPAPKLPALPKQEDAVKKLAAIKPIKADTTPDFDPYLSALREIEGTDHTKIKQLNATLGELLQLQAAGLADGGTAQAIEAVSKQLEALDPVARRAGAAKAAIDELLGIGADSSFSRYLDQMQELGRRREAGLISTDAYIAALAELDTSWRRTTEGLVDTARDAGDQIALIFSSAAGDALRDWQGFGDFAKGLLIDLAQLTAQETLLKPMAAEVSKAFKGFDFKEVGAQALKWLFNADGNAFDAAGVRRFASGDVFGSPTLFRYGGGRTGVMGEAGPEAVMPLKRGPDGKLGVAGGGNSVSIAINVGAGASTDDWRRSQRQIAADLQRGLRRAGGLA